jgi:hypothetical protein
MAEKYNRPEEVKFPGEEVAEIEASVGDSVRVTLKNGAFILISPTSRAPTSISHGNDLLIEVFPDGLKSLEES